jgi:hypothetical protein
MASMWQINCTVIGSTVPGKNNTNSKHFKFLYKVVADQFYGNRNAVPEASTGTYRRAF